MAKSLSLAKLSWRVAGVMPARGGPVLAEMLQSLTGTHISRPPLPVSGSKLSS